MSSSFLFRAVGTALLLLLPAFAVQAEPTHSVGLGAHYWRVIDDIDVGTIEESGLAYLGAYRYDGGILALQAEVEVFPEDFAGAPERVYSPQILLIAGDAIYAGIGAGVLYSDGEFADTPFYMIRAGFALAAFGPVTLDLNANYIFTDFDNLSTSDIDTDTVTLGAMVRVTL